MIRSATLLGENVLLHAHLKVRALIHAPADVGVFALSLFSRTTYMSISPVS